MRKLISICILFLIIMALGGCFGAKRGVLLLPEERIYTLPAGKPVKLLLDKKPIEMTFVEDMKVVHPTTLVRHEIKLNKETLKKIKAEKSRNKWMGVAGSLLTIGAGLITMLLRQGKKKKS